MTADKKLRHMNRTELIEIICALQQNEEELRKENERMAAELDDRKIRLARSGSIAEAALSLNRIFEDAQAAADQYLLSLRDRETGPEKPESAKRKDGDPPGRGASDPGTSPAAEDPERHPPAGGYYIEIRPHARKHGDPGGDRRE